ncbi:hypothetical protein KC347_g95 [Hortaea werneckii]|nr:hypothetical protein KC347_g95 [Hortaea werneckii]
MSARDVYLAVMTRGARTVAAAAEGSSSLILTATGARARTVTRRHTVANQAGFYNTHNPVRDRGYGYEDDVVDVDNMTPQDIRDHILRRHCPIRPVYWHNGELRFRNKIEAYKLLAIRSPCILIFHSTQYRLMDLRFVNPLCAACQLHALFLRVLR